MPPDREAALAVEEEEDDESFVDAAALARMSSSMPSPSPSTTTTAVATTVHQQQQQQQQRPQQRQNHLRPLLRGLKLGLASSYYNVAEVLRLRRLGEIVKGSGLPPSDAPVWILGVCYKNGEGGGGRAEAAEAAEDERVVVDAVGNTAEKGAPSTSTSGLDPEVAAAAAADWASIPWMTYRRGFPPIREDSFDGEGGGGGEASGNGGSSSGGGGGRSLGGANKTQEARNQRGLTSDVGWGCTLRSGQMLLAAAAQRVAVGRHWRRETSRAAASARLPPALERALALFADEPRAPLSVHSLLAAPGVAARLRAERRRERRRRRKERREEEAERGSSGEADRSESGSEASSSSSSSSSSSDDDDDGEETNDGEEGFSSPSRFRGLTPGEWLGPYTFCRAAEAALTDAWPSEEGGTGDPPPMRVLVVGGGGGGAPALDPTAAARTSLPPRSPSSSSSSSSPSSPPLSPPSPSSSPSAEVPLLVLVPVQAGLGRRINPVYARQLAAALRWPQSVGAVGGRLGSSLYFAGTASLRRGGGGSGSGSGSSSSRPSSREAPAEDDDDDLGLLFLDPHVPRPAVLLPSPSRCSSFSFSSSRDLSDLHQSRHHHPQSHRKQRAPATSRTRGVGAAKVSPPPAAPAPAPPPPPPPPAPPAPAIDPADFFSDAPPARPLPLAHADPSLALGFLCADDADYGDLVARAARLAARNPRWPLVSVMKKGPKGEEEEKNEEEKEGGRGGAKTRRRRASPSSLASLSRGQGRPSQQEREDAGDWELL